MSVDCAQIAAQAGSGVAAALRAVDCTAGQVTSEAFGRLFAPGGSMATALGKTGRATCCSTVTANLSPASG